MMSWPAEAEGDGLLLDGEGFDDALGGECVDHVVVDGEICESHMVCLSEKEVCALLRRGAVSAHPMGAVITVYRPGLNARRMPRAASVGAAPGSGDLGWVPWQRGGVRAGAAVSSRGCVREPMLPAIRVEFGELTPETVPFLGQAAYIQLELFENLARAVTTAPNLADKEGVSVMARVTLKKHHAADRRTALDSIRNPRR